MGGHVTAGVSGLSEWIGQIQSGDLRALAISSPERIKGVDIPTLKEQNVNVDLANWRAVVAPPGIDDAQKKALVDAVDAMVKSDAWKKVLADKDWMDLYMSGDEFTKYLADENARVSAILKTLGLVS
jgi:putative tricarboxylic transport membrane protein